MQVPRWLLAGFVVGVAFLSSGVAEAATKTVIMGTPPSVASTFERLQTDINAYFPSTVTIRQNDAVRFQIGAGFHNADLPPRGGAVTPLATPTGRPANSTDATGAGFWFNGQPALSFAPALLRMGFGKSYTYDGSKRVNTGLPLAERPKPMRVKFTRRGTFTYLCSLHPGMKGKVRVLRSSADVPTAAEDRRTVARQIARARAAATQLPKATQPANTIDVGVGGAVGTEYFGFVPAKAKVAPGTTVTFRMSPRTYDVHTATAGPGNAEQASTYLGRLAASFQQPPFDPQGVYPSEPPGTVASLSAALHGNGFWNSGVMDPAPATPLPRSAQLRFDSPGSYTFYCLIHPSMKGTVDVG